MSVDLLITRRDRGTSADTGLAGVPALTPVAAQDTYRAVWLPLAERVGLDWITLFEPGLPLPPEDFPEVLGQLATLRQALSEGGGATPPDIAAEIISRIDRVSAVLERVQKHPEFDVFIG